jgi:hypothetical protein
MLWSKREKLERIGWREARELMEDENEEATDFVTIQEVA